MQFNLFIFFLFSIIVIFLYYTVSLRFKKPVLLIASLVFYGMQDLLFLPLLIGLISISYFIAFKIQKEVKADKRKKWMIVGIGAVVITLIIFKSVVLKMPLGLSYYSFKIISYIADVYMGKREYEKKWINYVLYVSFFPQILSGPISRSEEFTRQLDSKVVFDKIKCEKGICLILSGMFKKIVIAERLAVYIDTVFGGYQEYPGIALWLAAFLYSLQIYFDFAGYSEMAIGITYLLGIETQSNFERPYFAVNIRDFWDRWHISLSQWLRDYIYIPLGGNRKGSVRKKINILITFLVSGFWHGSGSGYLVWGIYHGILNSFPVKKNVNKFQCICGQLVTFLLVTFGWIFFRLEDAGEAVKYITCMFTKVQINFQVIAEAILPFSGDYSCAALFLTVILFIIIEWLIEIKEEKQRKAGIIRIAFYIFSIILFGTVGSSSFIYMNY